MEEYHGIIVDASQRDKSIFDKLKILGKQKDEDWILYRIEVKHEDIEEIIKELQENMINGFYFHFYKGDKLIVVFKEKIFKIKTDKSTWNKVIEYGKSLGIPKEQLDFYPCKLKEETY